MYYYHFVADTPYCGTEEHYFFEYETPLTTKEINEQCQELAIHNGECYFYLVSGWAEDWDEDDIEGIEEEIENYYADCSCYCTQITNPEEWKQLIEEYE